MKPKSACVIAWQYMLFAICLKFTEYYVHIILKFFSFSWMRVFPVCMLISSGAESNEVRNLKSGVVKCWITVYLFCFLFVCVFFYLLLYVLIANISLLLAVKGPTFGLCWARTAYGHLVPIIAFAVTSEGPFRFSNHFQRQEI